jgi:ribosomal protein S18/ribosomal protein S6
MKKYEAVIILNPNLSTKVDVFKKDFEKLLSDNSFKIIKTEDVGRRQLAYSITNHNKGHYILFNLEGDPSKLLELETKIKYNESIIRHLFLVVKEHNGEDSSLFIESKNKKPEPVEEVAKKEEKAVVQEEVVETKKKKNHLLKLKKEKNNMSKYELPSKFDHKDTDVLKQFITETGKIIPARVTGISASNQRKVTKSIKIARFLALLPYTDMHQ